MAALVHVGASSPANTPVPAQVPSHSNLSVIELEMVAFFVRIAQVLGAPKSLGAIYGLLYSADTPLALDDIASRLKLSRGSASQGLRLLKTLGAVKIVYQPGVRRDHFAPETELRRLAGAFLKEQVEPQIEGGEERLDRLSALVPDADPSRRAFLKGRVDKLQSWRRQARLLLPIVKSFLASS